ncbi:MAG: immunoglobulin domain-containing protein [Limisphaerales bacterium]
MKRILIAVVVGFLGGFSFTTNCLAGPGAIDPTFNAVVNGPVYATVVQPNSRILIAGSFSTVNNISRGRIARLFSDGSLDLTFLTNASGASSMVRAMVVQPDGRILIGGDFSTVNSQTRFGVARLNVDGTLDGTFTATNSFSGSVRAIALQADGKVLLGGSFNVQSGRYVNLIRLNTDGSVDTSINTNLFISGTINALAVQTDGRILVGGTFSSIGFGLTRNNIARLETDGTPDVTFPNSSSTGAGGGVNSIIVQNDGKILIAGAFTSVNSTSRGRIARLNVDGSLDNTFNNSGASSTVYCMATQDNGNVFLGGIFSSYNGTFRSGLARTFPDGTLDTTFLNGQSGAQPVDCSAFQSDGKLLVGGEFFSINNTNRSYLARLYGDLYPPEIITQPQSKSTNVGASVTFTVNANNPTPVNFQWRKNGADIPGATLNAYPLFNVQLADTGSYSAFLTDSAGGTTSSNAVLVVGIPPVIANQPASLVVTQGQTATFTVGVSGTPLSYQWFKYPGPPVIGATNATYSIASTTQNNSGSYWVVATNFLGKATSSIVTLTVIAPATIVAQPASITVGEGSNAVINATVDGTTVTTQWYKNGVPSGSLDTRSGQTLRSYPINNAQFSDAADYFFIASNIFGVVTSQVATVTIQRFPPIINTQPASQNVPVGGQMTVFVEAAGTTLNYQWQKDGFDIVGETAPLLLRTNVALTDAGSYTVTISNPLTTITSAVAVVNVGYAPTITNQPVSVTNLVGGTATFSGAADGTAPIQLLWLFNGNPLDGQTNATLTVTNLQTTNTGIYALTATNAFGGTNSSDALLTVVIPSVIASLSSQTPSLQISGAPNATCVIETASSLTPPITWQPVLTNTMAADGTWSFVDTNGITNPEIYYRVNVGYH